MTISNCHCEAAKRLAVAIQPLLLEALAQAQYSRGWIATSQKTLLAMTNRREILRGVYPERSEGLKMTKLGVLGGKGVHFTS